ncbi:MAG: hypothetical protein L0Y56_15495 [Nitrospira sp.]|nr:hypothetical protein [Nitrospira sp.]
MNPLAPLQHIAEVEFADIVVQTDIAAPFAQTLEQGFREFMVFVQRSMSPPA